MIKAVFIDIDNTILSFSEYVKQAMREGFVKFGIGKYDDSMFSVFERINTGLWQEIERGELTYDELLKIRWNRIFEAITLSFDGEVFEKYFKECLYDSAIPEEHATEVLNYLSDKYVLAAASNGPYQQQVNRLKTAGMDQYFDYLFISEAIGYSKPSKEFFDYCFNELDGIKPSECVIIGDSISSDISGGKAYGLNTCLYMRKPVSEEDKKLCDYIVLSLDEIYGIL